ELNPNASALKDTASPEQLLSKDQLEAVIKNTIKKLPEDLRIALTLREFDNLSYDEIAAVMECPVGTVRSRIFRAREAIDNEIKAMRGD
ncbi:sigma-70 family RNA polymerase sigma factor, partial [Oleiphilus sp. HI0043]|uniref:sigma-70 family RNA polymerase sigma factor n=2 Tax=Oleiphilus TaxID=141450 RepID=UPI0012E6FB28